MIGAGESDPLDTVALKAGTAHSCTVLSGICKGIRERESTCQKLGETNFPGRFSP